MALNPLTPQNKKFINKEINNQAMNTQKTPVYFSKAKIRKNSYLIQGKKSVSG
jgi:hypothetical protein